MIKQIMKILIILLFFKGTLIYCQNSRDDASLPLDIDLLSVDGSESSSAELLKNQNGLILIFWLTTCKPCINEQNKISENVIHWQEKGIKVASVTYEDQSRLEQIKNIINKYKWKNEFFIDHTKKLKNTLLNNWFGVPQVFLFNKDGKILLHEIGYKKDIVSKLENAIDQMEIEKG